jgi:uncharacterized protein YdhG (YjbR/CyaY superfamily)
MRQKIGNCVLPEGHWWPIFRLGLPLQKFPKHPLSDIARRKNMSTTQNAKRNDGFSADEKAAMKERAREMKAEARRSSQAEKAAEAVRDLQQKIAEMPEPDRVLAERIHAIVTENGPQLAPKTWYGMPAYANEDGKVVCFFKAAAKFDSRYATLGFEESANLDDGAMWSTSFAVTEMTADVEAKIAELVRKAVS